MVNDARQQKDSRLINTSHCHDMFSEWDFNILYQSLFTNPESTDNIKIYINRSVSECNI